MNYPCIIVVLTNIFLVANGCPAKCDCDDKKVSCNSRKIQDSEIQVIASAIDKDTEILELIENNITSLNTEYFSHITKLKVLDVRRNKIKNIPKALPSLTKVKLSTNDISSISKEDFEGYGKLTSLDLYSNKLTVLKSNVFSNLVSVQVLYIEKNDIKTIEENAFEGMIKLRELDLSENAIENIYGVPFRNLPNLKTIYLTSNKLKRVKPQMFSNVTSLEVLYLGDNQIEILEDKSFENLSLQTIELENNSISKVTKETFAGLTVKYKIGLKGNPITCNCDSYFNLRNALVLQKFTGNCYKKNKSLMEYFENNPDNCTVCLTSPCKNNGVCTAVNDTDFTCRCENEFFGNLCELKNNCFFQPCMNNATCRNILKENDYSCTCHGNYTGKNCSEIKQCYQNPCLNNGTCVQGANNSFTCVCRNDYTGSMCEHILEKETEGSGISGGILVLIVLLVLLTICLVVAGIILWKRRQKPSTDQADQVLFDEKPKV